MNSPAGEYGILSMSVGAATGSMLGPEHNHVPAGTTPSVGLIYYQAGVAVISASVFTTWISGGVLNGWTAGGSKAGGNSS